MWIQRHLDPRAGRTGQGGTDGMAGTAAADLAAAFEYLQQVRLRHQADRLAAGHPPDDVVALAELTALQRRWLKDAVQLLHACQESVRIAFRTDQIG
jgi:CBS domain-containing protein